jgi:hypothetical protein
MRIRKISALALVAAAAGLTLTACDGSGTDATSAVTAPSQPTGAPLASPSTSGQGAAPANDTNTGTGSGSGSSGTGRSSGANGSDGSDGANGSKGSDGSGTADAGTCQTANLSFSHSYGMGEGEVLINLKNIGAGTCTMHGFPGVDLKSNYGTQSAARSHMSAPDVTLAPGQSTRFTLHYPPNHTGGSGVTFTSLLITPPNETHSHTMSLAINVPVTQSSAAITVDPVGAGK